MKMNSAKVIKHSFLALLVLLAASHTASSANLNMKDEEKIKALLTTYQQALNNSQTKIIVPLYTRDGIFMPSHKPTATGKNQIETAYQHVFLALDLNVKFHIDEIEQHGNIAFVRTTSDGKIKLREKNITIKNNSREIFILQRNNNHWYIYRYMFNEIN